MKESVYGKCPKCGGEGISRERGLNGSDECENGHKYKSADAIMNKDRFELRTGRFGVYFHDKMTMKDLSLDTVLNYLNKQSGD